MLPRFSHLSLNFSEFNSMYQDKYLSVKISITRNKKKVNDLERKDKKYSYYTNWLTYLYNYNFLTKVKE